MVQVLNTTGLNYQLEKTITEAEERIILISPYLKLSNRIKELIEDKNRLKVDIRIVYGKSELNSKEYEWLTNLPFVRLSFCENLHAKLYANENQCIVCSLNLYDFSQINNHEIGVLIIKEQEKDAYTSSLNEAQRLIRISTDNIQPLTTDKETTGSKESEKTNKESSDFTSAFHEEPLTNQNGLITD
ncbi:DNA repair protein, partial [Salmonella enterica subsp. enterica]|nr:DNA repair protein [Salmonella enterica subsp. enterica]